MKIQNIIFPLMMAGVSHATTFSIDPSMDFIAALKAAQAGDTLKFEAGTYTIPYVVGSKNLIELSQKGTAMAPIVVWANGHAQAIFDFSFPELTYVDKSFGFYVTGNYWEFHGIGITRAGYQGAYITGSYNSFMDCAFFENRNTGLEINKGGNHTLVKRCDSYRNYDPKKGGSMADGFGPKETQGAGNKFVQCRAWENSDDGFDAYESPETVVIEDSWAFRNGVNVFGYTTFTGNGNGFKMGGNYIQANHTLLRCVAFDNPAKGFDENNNTGGITIEQSIGYANGINFGMGGDNLNAGQSHTFSNNISYAGLSSNGIADNSTEKNNSWNLGITPSKADFQSLDTTLATATRDADGNIPATILFRLTVSSKMIDAGADLGYDYVGSAPDLGPFETESGTTIIQSQQSPSAKALQKLRYYNLLGKRIQNAP